MSNQDFIRKYGKKEYFALAENLNIKLYQYKFKHIISGFRLQKKKGCVTIYYKGSPIKLEIATVWSLDEQNLKKLLELKLEELKINEKNME